MKRKRQLLLGCLLLAFLLGHLNRLWWPGTVAGRFNFLDIVVVASVVWYGITYRRLPCLPRWLAVWLMFVSASFFIGIGFFGLTTQPAALIFTIRLALYGLFLGVSAALFGERRTDWVIAAGGLVALLGFIQLWLWPAIPISFIASHGFDPHAGRLFATWFDPNLVGIILVITTLVTFSRLRERQSIVDRRQTVDRRQLVVYWLAAVIQISAILLTQSRSAWLALAVGLLLLIIASDKKYLLLLISVGIMAFLLSPPLAARVRQAIRIDASASSRLDSWETARQIINRSPVNGVGYNNYAAAASAVGRYNPRLGQIGLAANGSDSSWLTIWATTGVWGAISWLIFMVLLAGAAPLGPSRALAVALVGALLINAWFINSLLYVFILFLMAVVFSNQSTTKPYPS